MENEIVQSAMTANVAYATWWHTLFESTLAGLWWRIVAFSSMGVAVYVGLRARNFPLALGCIIVSCIAAFGQAALQFFSHLNH
ncbi:MAG: hypothetical protein RBQ99_02935 [Trichlorobacter sp.]|nr:hypothetical protein [Trichlorobacter sp.]